MILPQLCFAKYSSFKAKAHLLHFLRAIRKTIALSLNVETLTFTFLAAIKYDCSFFEINKSPTRKQAK